MAELRVTSKTKFAILECKKFLEHLFLSRKSIAASLVFTKGESGIVIYPQQRLQEFLMAFWNLFFSSQWQSHLVKSEFRHLDRFCTELFIYLVTSL